MDNEFEETKLKYNVDNLVLFDYEPTFGCRVTILQQRYTGGHFKDKVGMFQGVDYRISSCDVMEIRDTDFFMKGRTDAFMSEKSATTNPEKARFWEAIFRTLDDFAVINTYREAENYLTKQDTEDDNLEMVDFKYETEPSEKEINKMISLVDLSTFCKIIQNRLKLESEDHFCSNSNDRPKTKDIGTIINNWAKEYLVDWAKAKYRFYKMFGDKLMIEKEVECMPCPNEASVLKNMLKSNFPLYAPILEGIAERIILENRMDAGRYSSYFNSVRDINKMTFTKFMSLYQNPELDTEISKMYQTKGKTKFTISINPIDYLTVSINKSGWKSCHNFFDGCYSTAGLSLMFDKTSLVGFSSRGLVEYNEYYKKFNWNNKMWREMIYVSENNSATVFSRQYPFTDDKYSKALRQLYEDQFSSYFGVSNKWVITKDNNKYIDVQEDCDLLYNDVKNGYNYTAVINKQDNKKDKVNCYIGKQISTLSNKEVDIEEGESCIW